MHIVRTPTLEIAYQESGPADGQPAILLHGWPSDPHDWDDVAPQLANHGFRVLVPWLRGFGPTRFLNAATPRSGQQAALGAEILQVISKAPLYFTDIAEKFARYDFVTIARALGNLHATEKLWQDPRGRLCVRGSEFAAKPPKK